MDRSFRWDPSARVNLAELDRQHEQLFRMVGELDRALGNGSADVVIDEVLEKLIQYTIHHFAAEESLMQQHGFPGLSAHRYDHQMLAQKLTKFNLSHKAGRPGIPSALLTFLQSWLHNHLLKADKEYNDFLNARGLC
jgi:hemerythrin-like metal-binding protein